MQHDMNICKALNYRVAYRKEYILEMNEFAGVQSHNFVHCCHLTGILLGMFHTSPPWYNSVAQVPLDLNLGRSHKKLWATQMSSVAVHLGRLWIYLKF